MCRSVSIFMKPTDPATLFFRRGQGSSYEVLPVFEVLEKLRARTDSLTLLMEDASKKSTKAGYDAAGMTVGFIPLASILPQLRDRFSGRSDITLTDIAKFFLEFQHKIEVRATVARSGGDLLVTWNSLLGHLSLEDTDLIVSWDSHVRQASQGDMYSEINAHPQFENLPLGEIKIFSLNEDGCLSSRLVHVNQTSLFYDTHNGDINDAGAYKSLLARAGFVFLSNSDSCVIPALKRFILEHLERGSLSGALTYLANTDEQVFSERAALASAEASILSLSSPSEFSGTKMEMQQLSAQLSSSEGGERLTPPHKAQGVLRDDAFGSARAKILHLIDLANTLRANGACGATIAAALAARIFEYSNKQSKFVFQSYTPSGISTNQRLGGGIRTMLRGGSRYGGEEGGELILHIPKPYDKHRSNIAVACASEENALKEQFALLASDRLSSEGIELAQNKAYDLGEIDGLYSTGYIKQGMLPIFDILPGEVVEVNPDGVVRIFDIYDGSEIPLVSGQAEVIKANTSAREERYAPLKVFRVEYLDSDRRSVACPFNKYGEEIRVVQPLALRLNSEKLFKYSIDGRISLRDGSEGIGLTFSAEDDDQLRERICALTNVVVGGAGTSNLINTIAAAIARKLRLHNIPIISLDAFTGSDTVPSYVGGTTLLVANSNSGGTSDTLRLTHELAGFHGVLTRTREEITRRGNSLKEVRDIAERLGMIDKMEVEALHIADLPSSIGRWLLTRTPWVYVVTNIEASALGNIARGLDPHIPRAAGVGITNLPEEECVGSTFAAMASLQWQIALHTYIGEVRGDISSEYAGLIYADLARLPEVIHKIVRDQELLREIGRMADSLVGGNFDFVYTGYIDGVPEEQAHKGAEMIQEMFAGWNFFQFQHGKYAHMKRRTKYGLGSLLGHNAPPPQWQFFNARALKSPREIGPRVGNSFVIAHDSDEERFRSIPDYSPDFVFTYPSDSIVLYPFQVIVIAQLISYIWGVKKKEIGQKIEGWNELFVSELLAMPRDISEIPSVSRRRVAQHSRVVLAEFLSLCRSTPRLDNVEVRRKDALVAFLAALADESEGTRSCTQIQSSGMLQGLPLTVRLLEERRVEEPLNDTSYLSLLKELAVELSTVDQARRLGDHFLVDGHGRIIPSEVSFLGAGGHVRKAKEFDYLSEYEGLGTLYNVEPVHPPKIAKAKKGWL